MKNCIFIASSTLKIKCGISNGMQEKVSFMGMVWKEKSVTRDHCSASRSLPNSDPV